INPVSWPILVVSLIGSFLSLGKKIYGHLNTNYRISEQKNMTDKYLNELQQEDNKEIDNKVPSISQDLHEKTNLIYKTTKFLIEQVETIKTIIITKKNELINIQIEINE